MTWAEAKAVAAQFELAGNWSGEVIAAAVEASPIVATPTSTGVTVDRAVDLFLSDHAAALSANTQKKYNLVIGKLRQFAAGKGYVFLEQIGPIDVREFRATYEFEEHVGGEGVLRVPSSANAIGPTAQLRGDSHEVIGVRPPGFNDPQRSQIWVPPMARSVYQDQWWKRRDIRPHFE